MRARKPSTTEGIAAKSSITGLTISFSQAAANSEVKSAAPKAKGRANKRETSVTLMVPTKSGRREYFGTFETGCQEKRAGFPAAGG